MTVATVGSTSALSQLGIDFDAAYNENVPLMIGVAVERFHISESDAQTLAHQIFLVYFMKPEDIRDARAWFVGAICNSSRQYLRTRARHVELTPAIFNYPDPEFASIIDSLPDQLSARQVINCLTSRCQVALRLRYLEGYTIPEIAALLRTTRAYAQKLVSRCLRQARERCAVKDRR